MCPVYLETVLKIELLPSFRAVYLDLTRRMSQKYEGELLHVSGSCVEYLQLGRSQCAAPSGQKKGPLPKLNPEIRTTANGSIPCVNSDLLL